MIQILSATLIVTLLAACSTAPFAGQDEYKATIEAYSAGDKQFSGLYDNFEFRATLLNEGILQAVNTRETLMYSWDSQTEQEEMQKKLKVAKEKTRLFMSFFTPRGKDDNLNTSSTIWKLYLHTGGKRYEGKAKKSSYNLNQAIALYPYHSRWTTAYHVEFPVATQSVGEDARFEITGPLGRREVTFSPTAKP